MARKSAPTCETEKKPFPTRLRKLMQEKHVTQKTLGKVIGVRPQTISLYCTGQSLPDAEGIARICDHFDISADWILGRSETKSRDTTLNAVCAYTGLSESAIQTIAGKIAPAFDEGYDEDDLELLSELLSDDGLLCFLRDIRASLYSLERCINISERMLSSPDDYLTDGEGGYVSDYWNEKTCDDLKEYRLWRYEAIDTITEFVKTKLKPSEDKYHSLAGDILELCEEAGAKNGEHNETQK